MYYVIKASSDSYWRAGEWTPERGRATRFRSKKGNKALERCVREAASQDRSRGGDGFVKVKRVIEESDRLEGYVADMVYARRRLPMDPLVRDISHLGDAAYARGVNTVMFGGEEYISDSTMKALFKWGEQRAREMDRSSRRGDLSPRWIRSPWCIAAEDRLAKINSAQKLPPREAEIEKNWHYGPCPHCKREALIHNTLGDPEMAHAATDACREARGLFWEKCVAYDADEHGDCTACNGSGRITVKRQPKEDK